jgi:hypothetical protein
MRPRQWAPNLVGDCFVRGTKLNTALDRISDAKEIGTCHAAPEARSVAPQPQKLNHHVDDHVSSTTWSFQARCPDCRRLLSLRMAKVCSKAPMKLSACVVDLLYRT